ncbi:MAG TPA: lipopolysaccharide biosynthesis protein, partial [Alphaproteobacteria bacterium]|nr:lipopolysaccharide biosynthesis protein [Alphaproteobacteria bacterium]
GLNQATVQKPNLNHAEVNAFFWVNVAVGVVLTGAVCALSPVVGWYYGDPRAVPLTMAMGFLVFVGALGNQHGALLSRRMQFGRAALVGVVGAIASLAAAILWAVFIGGYWAIYAGMTAGIVVPVIGVWIAAGWRPEWPRGAPGMRAMLKFGANITSANFSYFVANNLDNILIGRYWGDRELGFYDRAYKLLLFPMQRIVAPLGSVLIPVLSRLHDDPERYRRAFFKTLSQLTLATWPGILWAIVEAPVLVPALLGPRWVATAHLFRPLAAASLLSIINSPLGWLLVSQGRARDYARWSYVSGITSVAAIALGLPYGAYGVALGLMIVEYARTPFQFRYVTRRGPMKAKDILRVIAPQATGGAVSLAALMAYQAWTGNRAHTPMGVYLILIGGFTLSYASTVLVTLLFPSGRETVSLTIATARRLISGR